MDLEQLISGLAGFADQNALFEALRTRPTVKPLFQRIFNDGHGAATAEFKPEIQRLEEVVRTAEAAKNALQQQLDQWKKDNPDAAAIRQEMQDKLDKAILDHAQAMKDRDAADQTATLERARKDLQKALIAQGMDSVYAESLVNSEAVKKRITLDKKGGVKLLQPDKDIPYAESDLDKALEEMAGGLVEKVDPKFLNSKVRRGSAGSTTSGKADVTTDEFSDVAEEIRNDVARKNGRAPVGDGNSRADRATTVRNRKAELDARLGVR